MKALFIVLLLAASVVAQSPKPAPTILQLFDTKYSSRQFKLLSDGTFLYQFGTGGVLADGVVEYEKDECKIKIISETSAFTLFVFADSCKRTGKAVLTRKYNNRKTTFAIFDNTENVQKP